MIVGIKNFPLRHGLLFGFLLFCSVLVQASVKVSSGPQLKSIGLDVLIYEDKTAKLTIDDIVKLPENAFISSTYRTPNFSFTRSRIWMKIPIEWQNPSYSEYAIWQQYALTDKLVFYRQNEKGEYYPSTTGDQVVFSQREFPTRAFGFALKPKAGQTDVYYLALSGAGTLNIDLQLSSLDQAVAHSETRHLLYGFYYGGLIALFLYNLILFSTLRDRIYFFYSIYVLGLGMSFFDLNGLAFRYLWPNFTWMNSGFLLFTYLSFFAQAQFTRLFLNLSNKAPMLDKAFLVLMAISVFGWFSVFFVPTEYIYSLSQRIATLSSLLFLFAGISSWRQGYVPARFFTIAVVFYVLGVIVYILQNFGVLETRAVTNYAVQIGSSFEIILFSFAIANRIYHIKNENILLQEKAKQQLLESNQDLEQKIQDRTQDLMRSLNSMNEKHVALVAAQQQLIQSEKMSSLGTLVAGVAHEINNPTNFTRLATENMEQDIVKLKSFLLNLANDESDPKLLNELQSRFDKISSQLTLIHDGTERLAHIVRDLRSFSRLDASESEVAKPDVGLTATLNLVRAQYGDFIQIELHSSFPNSECLCYPAALNQVFMNLAVNGCQAILEKHRNESLVKGQFVGQLLVLSTLHKTPQQQWWQAEFHDDGIGMDSEVLNRIFEPFFSTKDVGQGTGLGLSVSYGIVQKHHGDLMASSAPNQGSCFRVRIPMLAKTNEVH